ncbi:MAG TPA: hypothetical protein VG847_14230 [Chitinophagaceae bacterium]|nr:hypothetical protein [Chitinophagaceae bacterium]
MKATNISKGNSGWFSGKKFFDVLLTLTIFFSVPVLAYLQVNYPVQKAGNDGSALSSGNTVKQSLIQPDKNVADAETAELK